MAANQHGTTPTLLVFSDDWGRHPSSCQHLTGQLMQRFPVVWVNTIGTRTPKLDLATFSRALGKLRSWVTAQSSESPPSTGGPRVISPRMWPWFTRGFDRRINRYALTRQVTSALRSVPNPVVALTTLPITADLVGEIPVSRWVYYCVDDFSQWPGLDGRTLKNLDDLMLRRADKIVCVSERLREIAAAAGRDSELLTHGVDIEHWQSGVASDRFGSINGPIALFWGVVDRRMDTGVVRRLSESMPEGSIVFVGPQQDPDPELLSTPRCQFLPPVEFSELPHLAAAADVLIMPYADLPVTRAMQPLKMKEYLATGLPVVSTRLPAVETLRPQLDVADTADEFASLVTDRMRSGTPRQQHDARAALADESWAAKARLLEGWLLEGVVPQATAEHAEVIA